jgi:hypothetical protein
MDLGFQTLENNVAATPRKLYVWTMNVISNLPNGG